MEKQTFGTMVAALRKEKGMTQLELAQAMGVTDKAVSKWERDLSYPDIGSIPKLAEQLNVSAEELMQVQCNPKNTAEHKPIQATVQLALKGVALAMGVAVTALSAMHQVEVQSAISMLGIGLGCLAMSLLAKQEGR